jgi:hypothetical protein
MQKWNLNLVNLKTKNKCYLKVKKLVKKAMNNRIRIYIYSLLEVVFVRSK